MSLASITLYNNDETRGLIAAIQKDNPNSKTSVYPGMVKIDCEKEIIINRPSVEEQLGRSWDVNEIHLSVISLAGNVDEDDDYFHISWHH
jgi:phenol hydroxylase P2 protein